MDKTDENEFDFNLEYFMFEVWLSPIYSSDW